MKQDDNDTTVFLHVVQVLLMPEGTLDLIFLFCNLSCLRGRSVVRTRPTSMVHWSVDLWM